MAAPDHIKKIYGSVEAVKRLSDRVVGIGPFGVGLDGLLALIPGAGGVYGIGAGAFLVLQGVRAEASPATSAKMVALLAADTLIGSVWLVGDAVDILFPAHLMAANALQKDIEARHGPIEPMAPFSKGPRKVGESSIAGGRRR